MEAQIDAILKRKLSDIEIKHKEIVKDKSVAFKTWKERCSVFQVGWCYVSLSLLICSLLMKGLLVKCGIIKREPLEFLEIFPHRLWQVKYFHHGFIENKCLVIKSTEDGSLCMIQPPPLTKRMVDWLAARGSLNVIVEPDQAHDSNARNYKLFFGDSVKLLTTHNSRTCWREAGDDKFITGVFDLIPHSTHELLRPYGVIEHINAGPWLIWNGGSTLLKSGSSTVLYCGCPLVHNGRGLLPWLTGSSGYRMLFHAIMYTMHEEFAPGKSFPKYIAALAATKPDLVLFQHGAPLPGDQISQVRYGLTVPFVSQQVNLN